MAKKHKAKKKNKKMTGECQHCYAYERSPVRKNARLRINPYDSEISGVENWEFICRECFHDLCADI